jgi:hypothetical protein
VIFGLLASKIDKKWEIKVYINDVPKKSNNVGVLCVYFIIFWVCLRLLNAL